MILCVSNFSRRRIFVNETVACNGKGFGGLWDACIPTVITRLLHGSKDHFVEFSIL